MWKTCHFFMQNSHIFLHFPVHLRETPLPGHLFDLFHINSSLIVYRPLYSEP